MKNLVNYLLLFSLFATTLVNAQVKIGDNPEAIDQSSILELESNSKAFVITRLSEAAMNAITPLHGALVYNTDAGCVFYYNGSQWSNLCEDDNTTNVSLTLEDALLTLTDSDGNEVSVPLAGAVEQTFTADPIVNFRETIIITQDGNNYNFEVGEITGDNIVDSSINGIDIQDNSITQNQLAPNSVGQNELEENAVADNEIDYSQVTLNDFTNDAGYITTAEIISADAGNDITDQNGAYYDDSLLQDAITTNATAVNNHINNDQDTAIDNEVITQFEIIGDELILNEAGIPYSVNLAGFNNSGSDDQTLAEVLTEGNSAGNQLIRDVDDPQIAQDAATKNYVDNAIASIPAGSDNQNLSLAGSNLNISGGTGVNLGPLLSSGADGLISNVALIGNNLQFTGTGAGFNGNVNLAPLANTDNQNLTLAGNTINISGGTGVDLTPILGSGADGAITGVTLNGTDLEFTGSGTGFTGNIPLASLQDGFEPNTDNQNASQVPFATYLTLTGADTQTALQQLKDEVDALNLAGGGEVNTASNEGIGGVGLFIQKTTANLEFKNINAGSNKITITNDAANNEIDIDIDDSQLTITEAQITDLTHTVNTDNQNAAQVPFTPTGNTTSLDVQAAIEEIQTEVDGIAVGGEVNTASNQGVAGVPTFIQKNGADLEFRSINAGSNKITITNDAANNEIDIDIDDSQLTITEAQITDLTHTVNTDNQNAAQVPFTPTGNTTSLDVQAAIEEIQTEVDGIAVSTTTVNGSTAIDVSGSGSGADPYIVSILDGAIIGGAAGLILDNSITASDLAPDSVDSSEIRIDAVGQSEIGTGAVSSDEIQDLAITNIDIASATIQPNKLAPGTANQILRTNATGTLVEWVDLIASGTTMSSTDNSISINQTGSNFDIEINQVQGGYGGATSVIVPGSIGPNDIGSQAIRAFHIADNAIDSENINDLSILNDDIYNGTIEPGKMSASGNENDVLTISGGAVVWQAPASGGLTAGNGINIAGSTINADVDGSTIDFNSGNQLYIPTGGITSGEIQDGTIGGQDIGQMGATDGDLLQWNAGSTAWVPATITITPDGNDFVTTGSFDQVTQNLTLNVTNQTPFNIDLQNLVTENELTNASNSLTLSSNGNPGNVTLSNGSTIDINVNDGDFSPTNEIQSVSAANASIVVNSVGVNDYTIEVGTVPGANVIPDFGTQEIRGGDIYTNGTLIVPDYVFENYYEGFSTLNDSYNFKELSEIEAFIKKHKHLPGITSAYQAQKDGQWNLSQSNLQNLEKIEELFLHTIEQEKKIKALQQENTTLSKELDALKKDMALIKELLAAKKE